MQHQSVQQNTIYLYSIFNKNIRIIHISAIEWLKTGTEASLVNPNITSHPRDRLYRSKSDDVCRHHILTYQDVPSNELKKKHLVFHVLHKNISARLMLAILFTFPANKMSLDNIYPSLRWWRVKTTNLPGTKQRTLVVLTIHHRWFNVSCWLG